MRTNQDIKFLMEELIESEFMPLDTVDEVNKCLLYLQDNVSIKTWVICAKMLGPIKARLKEKKNETV